MEGPHLQDGLPDYGARRRKRSGQEHCYSVRRRSLQVHGPKNIPKGTSATMRWFEISSVRFARRVSSHNDLARACVEKTDDAIRRVVLLGRISLYGPGESRLHDEIIAVAARWIDPVSRKARLLPTRAKRKNRPWPPWKRRSNRPAPAASAKPSSRSSKNPLRKTLPILSPPEGPRRDRHRVRHRCTRQTRPTGGRGDAPDHRRKRILARQEEVRRNEAQLTPGFDKMELQQLD